jgi:hypothetical protein
MRAPSRRVKATCRDLIQHVLDDRALGWDPEAAPREGSVEATIAFAEYATVFAATG